MMQGLIYILLVAQVAALPVTDLGLQESAGSITGYREAGLPTRVQHADAARHLLQATSLKTVDLKSAAFYGVAAAGALSVGGFAELTGKVTTGAAWGVGAGGIMNGDVDAVGAISVGATAIVRGNAISQAALTLGAEAQFTGNASAVGAVSLGAYAVLNGTVAAGGGTSAGIGAFSKVILPPATVVVPASRSKEVLKDVKTAYDLLWALEGAEDLNTALADDILEPGLYEFGAAWPLAAGRTVTFTGNATDVWVIRIRGAAAIGGNFKLSPEARSENIQWVVLGAFSLGAGQEAYGTVITPSAIAIAAGSNFRGRLFSLIGAIDIGAYAIVGSSPDPVLFTPAPTIKPTTLSPTVYNRKAHKFYRMVLSTGPASKVKTYVHEWSFAEPDGTALAVENSRGENLQSSSGAAFDGNQGTVYETLDALTPEYDKLVMILGRPQVVGSVDITQDPNDAKQFKEFMLQFQENDIWYDMKRVLSNDAGWSTNPPYARYTATVDDSWVLYPLTEAPTPLSAAPTMTEITCAPIAGQMITVSTPTSSPSATNAIGRRLLASPQSIDLKSAAFYGVAAAGALSVGGFAQLNGDVATSAAWGVGAGGVMNGDVDAVGAISVGATSIVNGNVITQAALTLGAAAQFKGNAFVKGAVSLGADAVLNGTISANGATSAGIRAFIGAITPPATAVVPASKSKEVLKDAKSAYDQMVALDKGEDLNAAIANDILLPGVYDNGAAWPLAASRTITYTGNATDVWIIRIFGAAAVGGSFKLGPNVKPENIFWLVLGAFSQAAGTEGCGNVITPAAISIAAEATFRGRLYSLIGAVDIGAYAVVNSPPGIPKALPSTSPTLRTSSPTVMTSAPTSVSPTISTSAPTAAPTKATRSPTARPTCITLAPTVGPTVKTSAPTGTTTTASPTAKTSAPIATTRGTASPTTQTFAPSASPTAMTPAPSAGPTKATSAPTSSPTATTSAPVTMIPVTAAPTTTTSAPTTQAPTKLSKSPTIITASPTAAPVSRSPTTSPTIRTSSPTGAPSTIVPTKTPSTATPTSATPTRAPTMTTTAPSAAPTTVRPTMAPSTSSPTATTRTPTTAIPTTATPTSAAPTSAPTASPTDGALPLASFIPSDSPTGAPTDSENGKLGGEALNTGAVTITRITPASRANAGEGTIFTVEGSSLGSINDVFITGDGADGGNTTRRRLLLEDEPLNVPFEADNSGSFLSFSLPKLKEGYHSLEIVGADGTVNEPHWIYFAPDGALYAKCPQGAVCPGGGRRWPVAGYWSDSERNDPIRCYPNAFACQGSLVSPAVGPVATWSCLEGHMGPACGQCEIGYFMFAGECDVCPVLEPLFTYSPLILVLSFIAAGLAKSTSAIAKMLVAVLALQRLVVIGSVAVGAGVWAPSGLRDAILLVSSFSLDPSLLSHRLCPVEPQTYVDELIGHFVMVFVLVIVCMFSAVGHVVHVKMGRDHSKLEDEDIYVKAPSDSGPAKSTKSGLLGLLTPTEHKRQPTTKAIKSRRERPTEDDAASDLSSLEGSPDRRSTAVSSREELDEKAAHNAAKEERHAADREHQQKQLGEKIQTRNTKRASITKISSISTEGHPLSLPQEEARTVQRESAMELDMQSMEETEEKLQEHRAKQDRNLLDQLHARAVTRAKEKRASIDSPLPPPPAPPQPLPPPTDKVSVDFNPSPAMWGRTLSGRPNARPNPAALPATATEVVDRTEDSSNDPGPLVALAEKERSRILDIANHSKLRAAPVDLNFGSKAKRRSSVDIKENAADAFKKSTRQGRKVDLVNHANLKAQPVDLSSQHKAKRRGSQPSLEDLVSSDHTKSPLRPQRNPTGLSHLVRTLSRKILQPSRPSSARTEARLKRQYSVKEPEIVTKGDNWSLIYAAIHKGRVIKDKLPPLIWDARGLSLARVFQHRVTQLLLLLGTVLHLQTCVVLVRGLHCIALPAGNYLISDMQTACYTEGHTGLAVFLFVLIAVYGVGFPLLCLRLVTTRLDLDQHTVGTQFALKDVASRFGIDVKLAIRARDLDLLGVFTRYVSSTSRTYLLAVFPVNLILALLLVPVQAHATVGLFVLGFMFAVWMAATMFRWPFQRARHNIMSLALSAVCLGLCCVGILIGPATYPELMDLPVPVPAVYRFYVELYTPLPGAALLALVVLLLLLPLLFSVWFSRRSEEWHRKWVQTRVLNADGPLPKSQKSSPRQPKKLDPEQEVQEERMSRRQSWMGYESPKGNARKISVVVSAVNQKPQGSFMEGQGTRDPDPDSGDDRMSVDLNGHSDSDEPPSSDEKDFNGKWRSDTQRVKVTEMLRAHYDAAPSAPSTGRSGAN